VVLYLWTHSAMTSPPTSPRSSRQLDWAMVHRQADASYRAHSNNNEFGLDNEKWNRELRQEMLLQRNNRSDEAFLHTLQRNQEWADLELLLRELTEFGAEPLLLSMPIHGPWYDQCGITYTARRAYYQTLREFSDRYHTAVVDFADHDADKSFCHDTMGHLAPRGLVYYSQVLDGFFHDEIPHRSELAVRAPVASGGPEAGLPSRPAPWFQPPHVRFRELFSATAMRVKASTTNPWAKPSAKERRSMIFIEHLYKYKAMVIEWFAQPWVRFVALTIYYLGILVGLIALYGKGNFSTPQFIYQNF
jgi:hypothetical protein